MILCNILFIKLIYEFRTYLLKTEVIWAMNDILKYN